jgi:hydrogenase nickel incorporation protein HypA/HybF
MHEVGLVRSLLNRVTTVIDPARPAQVRAVRVAIGPLAGVEPLLIAHAFENLQASTGFSGARLEIDNVPLRVRCESCSSISDLDRFDFHCVHCDSRRVTIEEGDTFRLLSVEIE